MPEWTIQYRESLNQRFADLSNGLGDRMDAVADGRVAPAVDDIPIGSGRQLRAAVLFFDIRGFSSRTGSPNPQQLKQTLLMLDCVIPMVMHVIYDHNGYVEKNTGDGVMGVIGADEADWAAANSALDTAITIFYVLDQIVNPFLLGLRIPAVNARIGIDLGLLLLARIGVPTGAARHTRNFLTAVGPAANIASKLQQAAGTNEILVGDQIFRNAVHRIMNFRAATPAGWTWIYEGTNDPYWVWRYMERRTNIWGLLAALAGYG